MIQPFVIYWISKLLYILSTLIGYMKDLSRVEKERKIRPSPEIDAFMKVVILNALHTMLLREHAFLFVYGWMVHAFSFILI